MVTPTIVNVFLLSTLSKFQQILLIIKNATDERGGYYIAIIVSALLCPINIAITAFISSIRDDD